MSKTQTCIKNKKKKKKWKKDHFFVQLLYFKSFILKIKTAFNNSKRRDQIKQSQKILNHFQIIALCIWDFAHFNHTLKLYTLFNSLFTAAKISLIQTTTTRRGKKKYLFELLGIVYSSNKSPFLIRLQQSPFENRYIFIHAFS